MRNSGRSAGPSLRELSEEEFGKHISKDIYGDLRLSDGIRPGLNLQLQQGYRIELHKFGARTVPVIIAAISREKIFDLFMDITEQAGEDIGIALESTHHGQKRPREWKSDEGNDNVVTRSILMDHEDLLVHDGCMEISLYSREPACEARLDDHKLVVGMGDPIEAFIDIMKRYGLKNQPYMQLIMDGEHLHSSTKQYEEEFHTLRGRLIGDADD